ncbi:VOC family protein [Rhodohalobacter sp. 614A]|uniref:VOC family protein n=1 Tax=Rhodohalobacter sp. 614A TaxID=2908649 RepID=UPI001F26EC40|nr:VOC family protein [Rhodohalobacter sp. 614A]
MKSVNPYLSFNGNTEEVFTFYQSVFGGELRIDRYKDLEDNMGASGDDLNKVANVALAIGAETTLYASDIIEASGQTITAGTNFSIQLETDSRDEAKTLFTRLSAGGEIDMPLMKTEWANMFGMITDKFGIKWMVYYPGQNL